MALSRVLLHCRQEMISGVDDATEGLSLLMARLEAEAVLYLQQSGFVVDYFTIRDAADLSVIADDGAVTDREIVVLAAARIGTTRLIDNQRFSL